MALLQPVFRGTWPQQSVPEKRMIPELTADGAEKVILQSTSLEDVRERRQNIHHGTSIEIPEPALGLLAHIVRGGPGIDDGVIPQSRMVRAPVAEVREGKDFDCGPDGHVPVPIIVAPTA